MVIAPLLMCPYVLTQQKALAPEAERRVFVDSRGADSSTETTDGLQKAAENKVASLMSVPIENKGNFDMGAYDRNQNLLIIKPLIPIQFSKDWRLIARIIQPIQWQPYLGKNGGGEFGLGDMNPTLFLSSAKPGEVTWGFGPTFILPTATDRILGQGKFSIGPEFAFFLQPGRWTYGTLIGNAWSVAGSGGRPNVNQMQLQYFISYRLKKGWTVAMSPIITANWKASSGDIWTVPFGGGVGKITRFGSRPVKLSAEVYRNVARPSGASLWSMRLQTEFLFPKRRPRQEN